MEVYFPNCVADEFKTLAFEKNEQKSEWFLKINPNGELNFLSFSIVSFLLSSCQNLGRLPALIDHSRGDFVIWESSAILLCNHLFLLLLLLSRSFSIEIPCIQMLHSITIPTIRFLMIPSRSQSSTANSFNGCFSLMAGLLQCT